MFSHQPNIATEGELCIQNLRELSLGDETLDGSGDGFGGSGKSLGVSVVKPNVDAVHGGELGDSRTHLTAAHHSDAPDLCHASRVPATTASHKI